jgi:hypothetical protein
VTIGSLDSFTPLSASLLLPEESREVLPDVSCSSFIPNPLFLIIT